MWDDAVVEKAMNNFTMEREVFELAGLDEKTYREISKYSFLNYRRDVYQLWVQVGLMPDNGNYLEVGSASGGSILCAGLSARYHNKKINIKAISLFGDDRQESACQENAERVGATIIKGRSQDEHAKIKNGSMDLIYIDGNHTYTSVTRDLENYYQKLRPGGIFLGHDFDHRLHLPVVQATMEFFLHHEITKLKNSCVYKVT